MDCAPHTGQDAPGSVGRCSFLMLSGPWEHASVSADQGVLWGGWHQTQGGGDAPLAEWVISPGTALDANPAVGVWTGDNMGRIGKQAETDGTRLLLRGLHWLCLHLLAHVLSYPNTEK